MAPWLPTVKVVLPYLTQIVAAAIPAFTHRAEKSEADEVTRRQITELQDAATHNAEAIKTLATQMQQVIQDFDAATARVEKGMQAARGLAVAALVLALAAVGLALYVGFR